MIKKVVILGPESTGKSTLCQMLAAHYNTLWCPEYAREYLQQHGTRYNFETLLTIAKGQLALEETYESRLMALVPGEDGLPESAKQGTDTLANTPAEGLGFLSANQPRLLFIDTDQYVMKVWCEYVFGQCHNWILRRIAERKYDLYLLCKPDLPWVKDDLREYPHEKPRQELYHMYKDILVQQSVPWLEITGSYKQRFEKARHAVTTLL